MKTAMKNLPDKKEYDALTAIARAAEDALQRLTSLGYGHIELDKALTTLRQLKEEK
jgi:hypothetical protein